MRRPFGSRLWDQVKHKQPEQRQSTATIASGFSPAFVLFQLKTVGESSTKQTGKGSLHRVTKQALACVTLQVSRASAQFHHLATISLDIVHFSILLHSSRVFLAEIPRFHSITEWSTWLRIHKHRSRTASTSLCRNPLTACRTGAMAIFRNMISLTVSVSWW